MRLDVPEAPGVYYTYSSAKFWKKKYSEGILHYTGKELTPDTLVGITSINESRFFVHVDDQLVVIDSLGRIDPAYSEGFDFYENNCLIKKKNGLYAVFSKYNEQLTDFIYTEVDSGHFPKPIMCYVRTKDGEIYMLDFNGDRIEYQGE